MAINSNNFNVTSDNCMKIVVGIIHKYIGFEALTVVATVPECYLIYACLLPGLLFNPEDGGDMFLRNVGWLSPEYMAVHHRRCNSSYARRSFISTEISLQFLLKSSYKLRHLRQRKRHKFFPGLLVPIFYLCFLICT
jgi:hypothetical protein